MRILLTGGTGYIGSAVVQRLLNDGLEINALARSSSTANRLRSLGANPVRGDLRGAEDLREHAANHDAVVHIALDLSNEGPQLDRQAVEALVASGCPRLIYTSGSWTLGPTADQPVGEEGPTHKPAKLVDWRPAHEKIALSAGRTVIRPGMVYGGKGGMIDSFFKSASRGGAAYVGSGENNISLVHRDDLAKLYLQVLEADGRGIFHAVDESPLPLKEIARLCSAAAGENGATRSIPLVEARKKLGPLADALTINQVVAAKRSREVLEWTPKFRFADCVNDLYQEWKS